MKTIFINGKFTAQRTTGVQRVAGCVLAALDRLLLSVTGAGLVRWVLICPPNAVVPVLRCIDVKTIGWRGLGLHVWEQLLLPFAARGGTLINLAGAAPLLKRAQVCTFHDAAVFDCPDAHTAVFGAWYRFLFRRIARSAPLLLTVSAFSKGRLVARLGIAPERVTVISESGDHMAPVQADPATLTRFGLRAGTFFVAVGSSNPVKNFRTLLAAFAALPSRCDARLVIVGTSDDAVFSPDGQLRDSERVVRAGPVSDEELKMLYQSAIALVFPSVYEGFGLPPLEAMVCGCPVAASRAASIPEVCGDAALYFDPRSPAEIAAAMLRLFDEPELCRQLRTCGTQRARTFSWESAAGVLIGHLGTGDTATHARA